MRSCLIALALVVLAAGAPLAADSTQPAEQGLAKPDLLKTAPPRIASPMMLEIRALLGEQSEILAELNARSAAAPNEAAALEIQREIGQVKMDVEIAILQVQAEYALADGRIEVAEEIAVAIAKMQSPAQRVVNSPSERHEAAAARESAPAKR